MGVIKKQAISNTITSYTGAVLGFVIVYFQPHFISADEIGLLRLLYSASLMAALIMPLGTGSMIMRFFPQVRDDAARHNGFFGLALLIATVASLAIAILLFFFRDFFLGFFDNSPDLAGHLGLTLFFGYILALTIVVNHYAAALSLTTFPVFLADVFTRLGHIAVVLLYFFGLIGRDFLAGSYVLVFVLQLTLLILYLYRAEVISFRISFSRFRLLDMRAAAIFALTMAITGFASLGIKQIDHLMLGHFLNQEMVGIYATSVMMCVILEIPFNSLDRIASPRIAHAWNLNDTVELKKIYEMSSRYLFFTGSLLFGILWSAIDLIYDFLPAEYAQGKMAFLVFSLASLINLLTGINSSLITFSRKYFVLTVLLILLLMVALVANSILIPAYGITGAALSTLVALASFNLLKLAYITMRFRMQPFSSHTIVIAVTLALSLLLVWLLPQNTGSLLKAVIGSLVTAALFAAVNVRFRIVPEINKVLRRFGMPVN